MLKKFFSCRVCRGITSLLLAAIIWLPNAHRFFDQPASNYIAAAKAPPKAMAIAGRHIRLWTDPELLAQWFGPHAISVDRSTVSVEAREGGTWNLDMHDENGVYPLITEVG